MCFFFVNVWLRFYTAVSNDGFTKFFFSRESALKAVEASLELEQDIHQSLLELHATANKHGDAQMGDFIASEFLKEQVEAEKEISDLITKMKRVEKDAIGLIMIDKELQ